MPLKEVAGVAQKVIDNMATMGLVMRSCTLPGSEQPLLKLASGTVEIGMGIHGEAGVKTIEVRFQLWSFLFCFKASFSQQIFKHLSYRCIKKKIIIADDFSFKANCRHSQSN